MFIEMLQIVLGACDSPQQASVLTKRIIDRARRANK
jgi:hypothetical protein